MSTDPKKRDAAEPSSPAASGVAARIRGPALFNIGVTVLAFGVAPVFKKAALVRGVDPWTVALITVLAAAAVIVLVAARRQPGLALCLFGRAYWYHLLMIGIIATGAITLLVSLALSTTTATNRSLFQAAYPAATLLFAHLLLGERLRRAQYLAIGVMISGLFLMNGGNGGVRFGQGFWLLMATLPLIGLGDVYGKHLTDRLRPLLLACGRNLYGALFVACVVPFLGLGGMPGTIELGLLLAGGACQAIGVWTLYRALASDKASLVAGLVATAPLVTAALEFVFLELTLAPWQWVGVALVIAAAIWLTQATGVAKS